MKKILCLHADETLMLRYGDLIPVLAGAIELQLESSHLRGFENQYENNWARYHSTRRQDDLGLGSLQRSY